MSELIKPVISFTLQYQPWVNKLVRKMYFRFKGYCRYEELLAVANLASLESESRYDPTKAKFSTYIKIRIEGAMIKSASTISNSNQRTINKMHKYIETYIQKYDVAPPHHLLLDYLEVTEKEFQAILKSITKVMLISPDDLDEDDLTMDADLDTLAEYAKVDDMVKDLSLKQQKAIQEFMEDSGEPSDELQATLDILRSRLGIKL